MEFPINRTITVTDEKDNKLTFNVRPYLLNSDIEIIESQTENIKTRQQRKNIAEVLLMRFCTDIKDFNTNELDIKVLDVYRVNGVIERVYDSLDDDSKKSFDNLIDINIGDEVRVIKLMIVDLMDSAKSIEDGTAQKALSDAIINLKEAQIESNKLLGKK